MITKATFIPATSSTRQFGCKFLSPEDWKQARIQWQKDMEELCEQYGKVIWPKKDNAR